MPAVGEKIAEKINLNPTTEMKNYIADWILDGAPNDTSDEAKNLNVSTSADIDSLFD